MAENIQNLEYLKDIYKVYLLHLQAVFNFFIVFSGLVLSGLALIVCESLNEASYIDEVFIAVGIIFFDRILFD